MAIFPDRMERIRRDLIQRARAESDAMERGYASHEPALTSNTENAERQGERRTIGLPRIFSRPLEFGRQPAVVAGDVRHRPETPKSPQTSAPQNGIHERLGYGAARVERPEPEIAEPSPAVVAQENNQGQDVQTQLRPKNGHRSRRRGIGGKMRGDGKKRFLFCMPWIKSGRVRKALMYCLTSGLFVLLLLGVYLGLSLTQHIQTNELTIMLLIIIIISTLYFCYNIVRLCLAVMRGDKPAAASRGRQAMSPAEMLKTGYAMPRRPIRVVLAQDEEAAGREDVANTLTPPAYGFWRGSVRLDPNRLYWQRNEAARREAHAPETGPAHDGVASGGRRPPSYASEDGVSYVVDAISTASTSTTMASRPQMAR